MDVYLGLGSNMGDRAQHLAGGVRALERSGRAMALSSVYETEPVEYHEQGLFLNMVVRLDTTFGPGVLLERVHEIEATAGRVRGPRYGPRTLDIDILLYGDLSVDRDGLRIPHPRMADRRFVLVPLLELAPELADPGTGRPYREHLAELAERDAGGVRVRHVMSGEELLDDGKG